MSPCPEIPVFLLWVGQDTPAGHFFGGGSCDLSDGWPGNEYFNIYFEFNFSSEFMVEFVS